MGTVGRPMEPVRVTAMASTAAPVLSEEGPERPVMSWTPSGLPPGISMPSQQLVISVLNEFDIEVNLFIC